MPKKYAVIGHPIGHTLSPFIHKRLFELSGVDAVYEALDISPENLREDYDNILKGLSGYNITIPHKQAIIPFLDKIDEKAKMYGSVNTVSNRDGVASGYTTDPDGFLKALEYAGIPLDGRVVILGCGGVARTMAYEALLKGGRVELAVREKSAKKAEKLINEIKNNLKKPEIKYCFIPQLSGSIDTLVNATPVGMYPNTEFMPIEEKTLKNCAGVFDAIYNPLDTLLIKTARKNGAKAEGGMTMLVWQAVVSHFHWDKSTYDVRDIEKLCADAAKELMNR